MISSQQKTQYVESLTDSLKKTSGFYFANFTGINVETITALRKVFRVKGIAMRVMKNTLIKRVLGECNIEGFDKYLKGPTSLIIANEEDPIEPAKLIVEFQKKNKDMLSIKAIRMEDKNIEGDMVTELAKMPGKRELQSQIISIALGAGAGLIGLIKGPGCIIAGQVKALEKKLEGKTQE